MDELIQDLRLTLELQDNSNDQLLHRCIKNSIKSIKRYIRNDKYTDNIIKTEYDDVVIELSKRGYYSIKNGKSYGIKSKTQGQRSITYQDKLINNPYEITSDLEKLLPGPFINVL